MTLREEIKERIDELDEAILPHVLKELESIKARGRFSQEFWDTLRTVRERNKDDDPEVILREVTEAVNADRQSRRS